MSSNDGSGGEDDEGDAEKTHGESTVPEQTLSLEGAENVSLDMDVPTEVYDDVGDFMTWNGDNSDQEDD